MFTSVGKRIVKYEEVSSRVSQSLLAGVVMFVIYSHLTDAHTTEFHINFSSFILFYY